MPGFYISFDGILFFEDVPINYLNKPYEYAKEVRRIKERNLKRESWPKQYWWLVLPLGIILGLFADFMKEKSKAPRLEQTNLSLPAIQVLIDSEVNRKILQLDTLYAPSHRQK